MTKTNRPNSEDVARAVVSSVVQELGRLLVQRNRDNRELRRILRYSGISRHALGVPVYNNGGSNETRNLIRLTNVVSDCRNDNRMRERVRLEVLDRGESGNGDK